MNMHIGVSPSGKATVSESVMRWFESIYPSQSKPHLKFPIVDYVFIKGVPGVVFSNKKD